MQSPNYQKNAHKAAQAERQHDYPMAVVFWGQASSNSGTERQKHWADSRCDHCRKLARDWDV